MLHTVVNQARQLVGYIIVSIKKLFEVALIKYTDSATYGEKPDATVFQMK